MADIFIAPRHVEDGVVGRVASCGARSPERVPWESTGRGNMSPCAAFHGAVFALLLSAVGCGGKVGTDAGDGEAANPDAASSVATPAEVAASCQATCTRMMQAGCAVSSTCPMDCSTFATMAPACAPLADAFIQCTEAMEPDCTNGGNAAFTSCDPEELAVENCFVEAGVVGSSVTTSGGASPVPADVCPAIPRPPAQGLGSCSESSGGSGGAGAEPAICASYCTDSAGNVWGATCEGSTCTCTYNGGMACTCAMSDAGGCNSCCP
jgi:hypothetical protein